MDTSQKQKPLAVVTGASSGIGYELAKCCAKEGFDLLIVADEPQINKAREDLCALGASVEAVEADLSTLQGVDALLDRIASLGRPVYALLANAGIGLGKGFLDQDFAAIKRVIDTNVTGTVYLIHRVGSEMRQRRAGRILVVGSIAGLMPGTFQAIYNGTKAFLDSFAVALRHELKDTGVTVSCLMPGPTDTEFFERAGMTDTKVGASANKADPADVAKLGFELMMNGEASVVHGLKNKLQAAVASVAPQSVMAELHRKQAEPGSGRK
jgi:short-subunit dehydrogenase